MSWKLWQKTISECSQWWEHIGSRGERANHKSGKKTYFFLNIWQVMSSPHEQLTLAPRVCSRYLKECHKHQIYRVDSASRIMQWCYTESYRMILRVSEGFYWATRMGAGHMTSWESQHEHVKLKPNSKCWIQYRTSCIWTITTIANSKYSSLGTDLFWNQILICRSVRQSWWAISIRLRRVR